MEIIIDNIKSFFGLESFNRQKIILPSQEIKMIEYHKGVERGLDDDEVHEYEVYKIKFFRWLIGLPHFHPRKDILVRIVDGYKKFISYRDVKIDYSRPMSISIDLRYDFKNIFREMTYGTESLPDLALALNDIINNIDSSYIYISTHICLKINEYNFL